MWPFPLSERGATITPGQEPVLAPGVRGYTVRARGWYYIPIIAADHPGQGDVSRFLDRLPLHENIRVPTVVNEHLAAALERRGFVRQKEFSREEGIWVEVYERRRQRPLAGPMPTYAQMSRVLSEHLFAEGGGEWAGFPMPLDGLNLVIEPRFPRAAELQEKFNTRRPIDRPVVAIGAPGPQRGGVVHVRNSWRSDRLPGASILL